MDTKQLKEFETTDEGVVKAVFSTLNVKDKDGDVTIPGAFTDGAPVRISAYGHASYLGQALPVGKGVIRMDGERALLDGKFFMETTHGRDTFHTVKGMGELGEWSYSYDVLDGAPGDFKGERVRLLKRLQVHEVSPVLLGAGVDTVTLEAKSLAAFSQEADSVTTALKALIDRALAFGSQSTDPERKEGRALSAANRGRLAALVEALREAGTSLDELLVATNPDKEKSEDVIRAALLAEIRRSLPQTEEEIHACASGASRPA